MHYMDGGYIVWRYQVKDTVSAWEEDLPSQQFRHDAANGPEVHLHAIVHPVQHDLGSTPVSGGHVACHLRISGTRQSKVQDL